MVLIFAIPTSDGKHVTVSENGIMIEEGARWKAGDIVRIASKCVIEGLFDTLDKLCLDYISDNETLQYVFFSCCCQGYTEICKSLLKNPNTDPSYKNDRALRWSCFDGMIDSVRLLVNDKRVNVDAKNGQALKWALEGGHIEIVNLLLYNKRN